MDAWLPSKETSNDVLFLTSFIEPTTACTNQLASDLSVIESMPASTETTAIVELLISGTVGVRLVSHADAVYKARKSEVECEDIIERLQSKSDEAVATKLFFDSDTDSMMPEALKSRRSMISSRRSSRRPSSCTICRRARKSGPLANTPLQRASEIHASFWAQLKASFKVVYVECINDVMELATEALSNEGCVDGSLLDFNSLEQIVK